MSLNSAESKIPIWNPDTPGSDYWNWREDIEALLIEKDLWFESKEELAATATAKQIQEWDRINAKALAKIKLHVVQGKRDCFKNEKTR